MHNVRVLMNFLAKVLFSSQVSVKISVRKEAKSAEMKRIRV
jgi:hypothetical protein